MARLIKEFCVDNVQRGQYCDEREMLTAMAKHCKLGEHHQRTYSAREIIAVHSAVSNVLNHNITLPVKEYLIEEICNGKAE